MQLMEEIFSYFMGTKQGLLSKIISEAAILKAWIRETAFWPSTQAG
jgi:hypothetical protein